MNDVRKLDPIPDAQAYLGGISRTALYGLIDAGFIKRVSIGRRAFITRESMDHYIGTLTA